jgi:hypothetical protein
MLVGAFGGTSYGQDQPIKRTELIRADVTDVPGKETVIYIADVVPGGEGHDIPITAMSSFTSLKARSLSHPMPTLCLPSASNARD